MTSDNSHGFRQEARDAIMEVVNECERWKLARVTVHNIDAFEPLCHHPAPMLVTLDLANANRDNGETRCLDLFNGDAPRLKDLRLIQIVIPWESRLLTRLRTLSLTNISGPPSVEQLRESL